MRFYHLSDKNDPRFPALYYDECDVLIAAGDLSLADFPGRAQGPRAKPAFGVYGNHCTPGYLEALGIENVHGRVVDFEDLRIGGFEGCPRYKPGPCQFDEPAARAFAADFPPVDILLLHCAPLAMLDDPDPNDLHHTGSTYIRDYVLRRKPALVFVGHQYSNADLQVGHTRIYRSYRGRIIDVDPRDRPAYPAPIPAIPSWMDEELIAEQAREDAFARAEAATLQVFPYHRATAALRHMRARVARRF